MCFSAEADIVAGVVVGAIGLDAVRHVTQRREMLLASLPLVFATHSLIEAFVWWGLEDQVPHSVGRLAIWFYLGIAFVLLPIMVPAAVTVREPAEVRRYMAIFVVLGCVVAVILAYALARGPVIAAIDSYNIDYTVNLSYGGFVVALYVLVTCGPLLLSRDRYINLFGLASLVAVGVLIWIDQTALISLWCFWAALTSVVIAVHVRHRVGQAPN